MLSTLLYSANGPWTSPGRFPDTLPAQSVIPPPGCGAALSVEEIYFPPCPARSLVPRLVVLVNFTDTYLMDFAWDTQALFGESDVLQIYPPQGTFVSLTSFVFTCLAFILLC